MNVLLIEDDEGVRRFLTKFLKIRNYCVVACSSAEQAMLQYEKVFSPLIVIDIDLPGISGIDFCRWVRKQPEGHRHFILIATGRCAPEDLEQVMVAGADDFMAKPFTPEILNLRFTVAEQQVRRLIGQKKLELELQREKDFISAVVETAPALILVLDEEGCIQQFNRACRDLTGYSRGTVQGERFTDVFLLPKDREGFELDFTGPNAVINLPEIQWTRPDHMHRFISWSFSQVLSEQDRFGFIIGAGMDVTERRAAEERSAFLAERDSLTKCYNRSQLYRILQEAAEQAGSGSSTVLLYIDVDNFKAVNDTLGHACGDRVLITLVLILRQATRNDDITVRFGGDEFIIVLHQTTLVEAQKIAERIRTRINDYQFNEVGESFNVSASIGLFRVDDDTNGEEIFTLVESACYTAKARGRNRVESYQPDNLAISRLIADSGWWTRIKEAIRQERLEVWFQPVVHVSSLKVGFYECLVRFRDEDNVVILPYEFLPAVERSGGMSMLDQYVIGRALSTLANYPDLVLSVNVSGKSVNDPAFIDFIVQAFARNNILPSRIIFEIPENVVINLQEVWRMLDLMKAEGFRFALDDFGAGFCSISYLKHLPVEMLKIDGSFIKNVYSHPMNQALVRSVNETAHILKLRTVAEFVEDLETLEVLREIGIDYAQGYFFGKPEPLIAIP